MISFERMGVRARLTVAGVVVLVGLVVMAAYTLMQIRTDAMNAHSERIKHLVEVTTGIVADYQKLEAEKKMTREEAQAAAGKHCARHASTPTTTTSSMTSTVAP